MRQFIESIFEDWRGSIQKMSDIEILIYLYKKDINRQLIDIDIEKYNNVIWQIFKDNIDNMLPILCLEANLRRGICILNKEKFEFEELEGDKIQLNRTLTNEMLDYHYTNDKKGFNIYG